MREVLFVREAGDLALATSHLAQSSSASRVTAAQAEPFQYLFRLLLRVDLVAGLEFCRCEHGLLAHAAPGLEAGAFLDVVVLHLEEARLCPLAVRAVAPASHDGFELVLAEIVRDLV